MFFAILFSFLSVLFVSCGSGSSATNPPEGSPSGEPVEFSEFITEALDSWLDVDYSQFADGYSDTDYDGQVDCYDAVVIIESLRALGYNIPKTTNQGLYENYYNEAEYDILSEDLYDKTDFVYTLPSTVTEAHLKAGDFSGLEPGHIIFLDYDIDDYWDYAMIYIGEHPGEGFTHAAIFASDYYDRVLIVDLENDNAFDLDISYGFSDVRILNFEGFEAYYEG